MSRKLQRSILPLVAFAGLALLPVASFADDGSDGGGAYDFPASNVKYEPAVETRSLSCAEATRAAWFHRQMEISDGDVTPSVGIPSECDRKVVAQAGNNEAE